MRKPGDVAGKAGKTKPEEIKGNSRKLRTAAEKKIARSTGKSTPRKKQNPDKLMRELEVLRVELEAQNEQFRRTKAALKSREQEYRLIADYSIKLKDISILLNEAPDLKGLFNSVAESFRLFTNSIAATFTVFNKENQTLQVVSLSADPAARPRIVAIFGPEIFEMRMPISPDIRDEILNQKIRRMKDLHELSLGVISQGTSDLFMQSVGCKQIVACSISDGADVAGICAAYLPASLPMVPDYVLNSYLYMVRLAIKRMQTEEGLRKSEEKYRLLADHTTDFIWLMDMNLNNIYVSPSVIKRTGFTEQEMMELPLDRHITPDSLKVAAEVVLEFIPRAEADTQYNPTSTFDMEYCCKDGTTFWAENKFSVIRDSDGKPVSILGEARDITDRRLSEDKLVKSYESVKKTLDDAINTMVKIVELRDPYTAGHQQKVADLATAIAREMKLDDTRIERLRTAAIIHDIGKIYVPSEILSKPGKLADIELSLIKTHSQSGYDIVKSMDFHCNIANTILQHHERLDGSGYPNGLKGEDTLLEAKILTVADVVEAMASNRPYRPALGIDKALEEISNNRGRLYEADVVDTCVKLFKENGYKFEE